ncbi:hypothetical protein ZIOFF_022224 [Zingiber officinale]|uniref:Uncharacterized protein n=1 Tax=Zingiber officinale TaxID=94328 RepID=A0A8J5H2J6_ZINOF|nr:hypothetical protein ZIOFF_022224 [Zingiber officinale]
MFQITDQRLHAHHSPLRLPLFKSPLALTMSMAFLSPPPPPTALSSLSLRSHLCLRSHLTVFPRKLPSLFLSRSAENGAGEARSSATLVEEKEAEQESKENKGETTPPGPNLGSNGAALKAEELAPPPKFKDPRWVGGTWDLKQFMKDGKTNWDAVLDADVKELEQKTSLGGYLGFGCALSLDAKRTRAEYNSRWISRVFETAIAISEPLTRCGFADFNLLDLDGLISCPIPPEVRRRKWLEDNPEASSNEEPVIFEASIIPWLTWIKRFHLPEAELLNGRAAMIGFFMAYFVDSLTGVGLVDQMGNFFCKTLLFVAVAGVLLIRKNDDLDTLKKLLEETTFYDNQWRATWLEDKSSSGTKGKE